MTGGHTAPRWMLHLYPPYLLSKVRDKGLAWCLKKLPSYTFGLIADLSLLPLAILLRVVLLVLKPFVHIRFGQLWCDRLGPFAMFAELYLCEQDAGMKPSKDFEIWYHYDRDAYMLQNRINPRQAICNQQLNVMWERLLRVHDVARYFDRINRMLGPGSNDFLVDMATEMADREALLDRFPAHLAFTDEEEERGLKGLQDLGIGPDDKFVCFHARDSTYLDQARPRNVEVYGDWSAHDIRDVSIHNYLATAETLTELGYFAVRMGKHVREPLDCANPRIIDYASHRQSDFMDVFLAASCTFFIGQNSGMIHLPQTLRTPVVMANVYPIGDISYISQYSKGVSILKKYYSDRLERSLSLREVFDLGLGKPRRNISRQELSAAQGIRIVENTPDEIREAAIEMHQRLNSAFSWPEEDRQLQERFWSILCCYPNDGPLSAKKPTLAIGSHFLRTNEGLLD